MSRTRKQEQRQSAMWLSGMMDLLKGGALGGCAALVVLLAAACLIWAGLLSNGMGSSAVTAACLVGGFVSGMFAVRRESIAPLAGGIGAGMVLFLLLLCVGVLVYDALPGLHSGGVVAGACLCGGGLSGVLYRSGGGKKHRKRKH